MPELPIRSSQGKDTPIGVAILGGGIFAREEHKPAVEAAKTLVLKAAYSRSLKSVRTLEVDEDKVDYYSDDSGPGRGLDDLLLREDIEAVIIALPILNQPDYIRKALLAGKHVLSEKPIAENVEDAEELIRFYRTQIDTKSVIWAVAENYRFLRTLEIGAAARATHGQALTFRLQVQMLVAAGGKYYETEWRKAPLHQGGFLLDGGVHFVAGIRLLLGKDDPITSVSANTAQLQKHLPPLDTIEATARTKKGAVGSISISFGTTAKGQAYTVASEKGVVSVGYDQVTVGEETRDIKNERTGVPPEVRTWGESLVAGRPDPLQTPEEALADLSVLEAMLKSGEQGGRPVIVENQEWQR